MINNVTVLLFNQLRQSKEMLYQFINKKVTVLFLN